MTEKNQSAQHGSLLTCGNGGIFLQFDLPNSLVEYNKMLGSRPRDTWNVDYARQIELREVNDPKRRTDGQKLAVLITKLWTPVCFSVAFSVLISLLICESFSFADTIKYTILQLF